MRGTTLLELLVAFIIVTIMMIGIYSANNAIHKMNQSTTYRSALAMRTQALADMIANNARYAVGSSDNVGVCLNNSAVNSNFFCFRVLHTPRTSPDTYDWSCYTRLNSTGATQGANIWQCVYADNSVRTGANPNACNAAGQTFCDTGDSFVGTMAFDLLATVAGPTFSVTDGFTMTVVNRDNPTIAKSGTNPEVRSFVSAYPLGHSR